MCERRVASRSRAGREGNEVTEGGNGPSERGLKERGTRGECSERWTERQRPRARFRRRAAKGLVTLSLRPPQVPPTRRAERGR